MKAAPFVPFLVFMRQDKSPRKSRSKPRQPAQPSAFARAMNEPRPAFPNISARWLLFAGLSVLFGALSLAWLTLCLLYWQGSWQLLYHPDPTITRTPASVGLEYQTIHFATTETGQTQLAGWWIPKPDSIRTVLYLHGATGNLSNTVDSLASLNQQRVSIFAIDYRGYGPPQIPSDERIRPTEKQLRQDAEWALTYLTLTRHIDPKQIVVYGSQLGANLALELAADHQELAGVVLEQPLTDPMVPLFQDPRSRLVPAHRMVQDKYDLAAATPKTNIPSLWLISTSDRTPASAPPAYLSLGGSKTVAFLNSPVRSDPNYQSELKRWLDDLHP